MSKPPYCKSARLRRGQQGDMLVESLIGVVLFSIAGMGISHIASKVAVSQRDAKVQHQVINELRSRVINRSNTTDLCDGSTIETQNFTTAVGVSGCSTTTAIVDGHTITDVSTPVILSATIEGIGNISVGASPAITPTDNQGQN
ncbi:type IV pilus modification PilV family protein [Teredinibacter haidensis]|uniref:type IV pilus modification PilV family protein n=1 Tax=Teredinibacter haidensis TaxID=2731755 RepID=UPI000948E081|nr:hypothetical protein [Teredinibacter haidensis]